MGGSHGRCEVPSEKPSADRLERSARRPEVAEVQCFGVVRHASRADTMGATWHSTAWVSSGDFALHPLDPPLSDQGRREASEVAQRIVDFLEQKGSEIQARALR